MYERNEAVAKVDISKGSEKEVDAVTSEPISVLTKKGENIDNVEKQITVDENVKAPVKKGDKVGVLVLKKDGKVLSQSDLVAGKDSMDASWWQLFKRSMGHFSKLD